MVAGLVQGVLQGGNVLEAVAGHDPVIVVGGDQEDGRVLTRDLLLDVVVEQGDLPEVIELLRHVTAAVVTDPGVANGKLLEP